MANDDNRIMRQVMRERMKRAKRNVAALERQLKRAEDVLQRYWDKRTAAEEALSEARYQLSLVERDHENWHSQNKA